MDLEVQPKSQVLCGCGVEYCRPGQRMGLRCHAKAMKRYRQRSQARSAIVGLYCMADSSSKLIEVERVKRREEERIDDLLDVAHLNWKYPKYPVTISDKGWVYGTWYCPTAWMKTHFHGQFPLTFLKRALALFPKAERILQCPCGTVTGPGVTVDLIRDAKRNPQVIASADRLPFKASSFDLYISDPPYTDPDSEVYGCPPFPIKRAMREAHRVLRPGGYFTLLHLWYPSFSPLDWHLRGFITVVTGAMRKPRLYSLFEKV